MKTTRTEALAHEPTGRLLIKLSAPAMAGMFLVSIYNVVDAFFVGRSVGPMGIAAVFITFPASLIIMAFAQTFGVGGASVISRNLGAGRHDAAQWTLGSVLSVGGICGLILGATFWFASKSMISFLGGSQDIMDMAMSYAHIIFFGTPMYSLMMIMNNLVRGEGNTQLSMWSMAISSMTNILLDYVFIFIMGMGVAGAAIATIISQSLAMVWLFSYYISDRCTVPLKVRYLKPNLRLLGDVVRVGASAFVRQAGIALCWAVLNKVFAATGGDIAVAVSGIVQRMNSIMFMPVIGMGHGLLPIVGYNYGAESYDRLISVMRKANLWSTLFCIVCGMVMFTFPREMLSFFSDDITMLDIGVIGARFTAIGIPVLGMQVMISTFYQGIGKGFLSFILSMLRPILIHPILAVCFAFFWGLFGTWASFPVSQIAAFAISFLLYRSGYAEVKGLYLEAEAAKLGSQPL